MFLLFVYVSIALGVSFVCSVLEAVLLSISPGFIAAQKKDGGKMVERLIAYKRDIDRPLAAILSLNTIAHTVGAAGAGAQAASVFGEAYLGLVSAILTLLILVVSEIIPKTLGALYWRELTPLTVRVLGVVVFLMWPLVKLSKFITVRLANKNTHPTMDRDEITAIAELGEQEGVLDSQESSILQNLLNAKVLSAADVMTPRIVVCSLPQNSSVGEVLQQHSDIAFSRIPIYDRHSEAITGYILKNELYLNAARDRHDLQLATMKRTIQAVQTDTPLSTVLERLLSNREHIALVLDEYGGLAGIITTEDIFETVLGVEIRDESDAVTDMQAYARHRFQERARAMGLDPEQFDQPTEPGVNLRLSGGGKPPRLDEQKD